MKDYAHENGLLKDFHTIDVTQHEKKQSPPPPTSTAILLNSRNLVSKSASEFLTPKTAFVTKLLLL